MSGDSPFEGGVRKGGDVIQVSGVSNWCSVFGVRCSMFSIQCSVFDVRCSMFSVRCSVFSVQCSVFGVRCSMFDVQCSVFGVQCSVFGVRCSMFDVQCSVFIMSTTPLLHYSNARAGNQAYAGQERGLLHIHIAIDKRYSYNFS